MNTNYIALTLPFAIYLVYILYKLYLIKKTGESSSSLQFAKGENNYPVRIIFFTTVATMIGPGYSYGAINKLYDFGFFFTIFFLLAMFQIWIFGHFFVGKLKKYGEHGLELLEKKQVKLTKKQIKLLE